MRARVVLLAGVAMFSGLGGSTVVAQGEDVVPTCKKSQMPKKIIEDGKVVFLCVDRPPAVSAAKQFRDFIHGNQFRRGKRTYSFCMGHRYVTNGRKGGYKVTGAKRVKRGSRVTITATIHLRQPGKRTTLKSVLTTRGLKLNGKLYGFAGPPDAFC